MLMPSLFQTKDLGGWQLRNTERSGMFLPCGGWDQEPELILAMAAAGKADTRSAVNKLKITSLAYILSQVNLCSA